jgi:predicted nucleotidyltransferase
MAMSDLDIAQEAVRRIVAQAAPTSVYWFGSRSEGRGDNDSDFDLFVVLNDQLDTAVWQRTLRRALLGLPAAFDIVAANASAWARWAAVPATLEHRVALHGVKLYDAAG